MADGGAWIPVINRRRQKERQSFTHTSKIAMEITFYFTNFPHMWNHLIMKDIFAKYGEVVDVFIARKRNNLGKRFGFVRFVNVDDIAEFENTLNSICIGTMKMACNVARFQRQSPKLPSSHSKPKDNLIPIPPRPTLPNQSSRSFVDILKGNIPSQSCVKHISLPQSVFSSSNSNYLVAELKNIQCLSSLYPIFSLRQVFQT